MKVIVISGVNLVEAGTLAILRDCLQYLSELASKEPYRIIAIVHKRSLADFPNIDYIETQWPKKRWLNRIWFEYVSMKKISKNIGQVYLWFSLHDTSPNVIAELQAVYCHNTYFLYKWTWRDLFLSTKIALFSIFTKYIYRINIRSNDFLVVQQDWFRDAMIKQFPIKRQQVIVAPPPAAAPLKRMARRCPEIEKEGYSFVFAASPNSHKNFECICRAAALLEGRGIRNFKVYLTVDGTENTYAKWLYKKWGAQFSSLAFVGFLKKEQLLGYYESCNCLIFPSKIESWGLPISEFGQYGKPMLLANLPYARATAEGSKLTSFFEPDDYRELAAHMQRLIAGDHHFLQNIATNTISEPVAYDWNEVFKLLLLTKNKNS